MDDGLADLGEVGAELLEHLGGDALTLADEAKEDVLGTDVVVAELEGLSQRQLEDLLRTRGEGDVARRRLLALADDLHDLLAHRLEVDAHALERPGGDTLTLGDEAKEDVLGTDVVVVEPTGLFLREDDHPTSSVREALEHVSPPWSLVGGHQVRRGHSNGSGVVAPGHPITEWSTPGGQGIFPGPVGRHPSGQAGVAVRANSTWSMRNEPMRVSTARVAGSPSPSMAPAATPRRRLASSRAAAT